MTARSRSKGQHKPRARVTQRERLAYHEAGHALIGHLHFGNPGRIWIDEHGNGHATTLGITWTADRLQEAITYVAPGSAASRMVVGASEMRIRHALAGLAAVSVLTGRRPSMKGTDMLEALMFHHAVRRGSNPGELVDEWGESLAHQYQLVRKFLRRYWSHVDVLAQALLASDGELKPEVWVPLVFDHGDLPYPFWEVCGPW